MDYCGFNIRPPIHQPTHLYTSLSIYPSIYTPVHLHTHPPINPAHLSIISPLTNLPTHPHIYSPTYLSSTYLLIRPSHSPVHSPTHPYIHPPIHLATHPLIYFPVHIWACSVSLAIVWQVYSRDHCKWRRTSQHLLPDQPGRKKKGKHYAKWCPLGSLRRMVGQILESWLSLTSRSDSQRNLGWGGGWSVVSGVGRNIFFSSGGAKWVA